MTLTDRVLLQNRLARIVKAHFVLGTVALVLSPLVYWCTRLVALRYRKQLTKASFEVVCLHSTVQHVIPASYCVSSGCGGCEYDHMLLLNRCRAGVHGEQRSVSKLARLRSTLSRSLRRAPCNLTCVPYMSFAVPQANFHAETCITALTSDFFSSALAINQTQRGSEKDFVDVCGRVVLQEYCGKVITWCTLHALTGVGVQVVIYVCCTQLSRTQATRSGRIETDVTRGAEDNSPGTGHLVWLRWAQRMYAFCRASSIRTPEVNTLYGLYDFSVSIPHPQLLWMPKYYLLQPLSTLVTSLRFGGNPQWTNDSSDLRYILQHITFHDSFIIALTRKTPQVMRGSAVLLARMAQPLYQVCLRATRLVRQKLFPAALCDTQAACCEENSMSGWQCRMCSANDYSFRGALHHVQHVDGGAIIASKLQAYACHFLAWIRAGVRTHSISWTRCVLFLPLVLFTVRYQVTNSGAESLPHWSKLAHLFQYTYSHLVLAFWLCKV